MCSNSQDIKNIINICEGLGEYYVTKGEHEKAIQVYSGLRNASWIEDVQKPQITLKQKKIQASLCLKLGHTYRIRGDIIGGTQQLKESLKLAEETGDKSCAQSVYCEFANILISLHQYEEAVTYFQKQLEIAKELGDKTSEFIACGNLSACFLLLCKFPKALEYAQECLWLARETESKERELLAYGKLGQIYDTAGKFDKSIENHEKELTLAKALKDREREGIANGGLGNAYFSKAEYTKALSCYERYMEIASDLGDENMKSEACTGLGLVHHKLGDNVKAVPLHEKSLEISTALGDERGQSKSYGNLGDAAFALSNYKSAIDYYDKCLKIAEKLKDKQTVGMAYYSLGNSHYYMGDYREAIEYQEKALEIAKGTEDKVLQGNALGGVGNAYYSLNEFNLAIEYYEQNLKLAKEVGYKAGEANAHGNLGNAYDGLQEYKKAVIYLKENLKIAREIGDKAGEARANGNLGNAFYWLNEQEKAILHYKEHRRIAKEIGDKMSEGRSYGNLGKSYKELGEIEKAFEHYNKQAVLAREVGDRSGEASAYYSIATLHMKLEDWRKAEDSIRKCLQKLEEIRQLLRNEDSYKVSIGDQHVRAYKLLAITLLLQEKKEDAFLAADRGRAMALRDLMLNRYNVRKDQEVDETSDIENQNKVLVDYLSSLKTNTDTTTLAFSILLGRLYIWVISSDGVEVGEVMIEKNNFLDQLVKTVNSALACVECDRSISECDTELADEEEPVRDYFAVVPDRTPREKPKSPGVHRIEEKTNEEKQVIDNESGYQNDASQKVEFKDPETQPCTSQIDSVPKDEFKPKESHPPDSSHNECSTKKARCPSSAPRCIYWEPEEEEEERKSPLRELYNVLIKPVEDLLRGKHLVIIPEDLLYRIPFSALIDSNDQFLVDRFNIQISTSLQTLVISDVNTPEKLDGALIIGNPTVGRISVRGENISPSELPGAQREAEAIAKSFDTSPLLLRQATKARVVKLLPNAGIIHIAAHGDPRRGEIYLSPSYTPSKGEPLPNEEDFLLTCSDIAKVHLQARLVVLSCCKTGCGKIRAEGVVGIARAFLGAGAASVVVTLWSIADEATVLFMENFYEFVLQGFSVCTAVRKSMNVLRRTGDFERVANWAPFYVVGQDVKLSAADVENVKSKKLS